MCHSKRIIDTKVKTDELVGPDVGGVSVPYETSRETITVVNDLSYVNSLCSLE